MCVRVRRTCRGRRSDREALCLPRIMGREVARDPDPHDGQLADQVSWRLPGLDACGRHRLQEHPLLLAGGQLQVHDRPVDGARQGRGGRVVAASAGRIGRRRREEEEAGGGNRTLIASLEGWSSTIELHPRAPHSSGPAVSPPSFKAVGRDMAVPGRRTEPHLAPLGPRLRPGRASAVPAADAVCLAARAGSARSRRAARAGSAPCPVPRPVARTCRRTACGGAAARALADVHAAVA